MLEATKKLEYETMFLKGSQQRELAEAKANQLKEQQDAQKIIAPKKVAKIEEKKNDDVEDGDPTDHQILEDNLDRANIGK